MGWRIVKGMDQEQALAYPDLNFTNGNVGEYR